LLSRLSGLFVAGKSFIFNIFIVVSPLTFPLSTFSENVTLFIILWHL
jgi:hypothetical protein